MNTALALKLEKVLDLEEGTLMILQVYYDIKREKKKSEKERPDLSKIRAVVFWDTNLHAIEWNRQYKAVIRRIFERGNKEEKAEITKFYGKEKIKQVLHPS